EALDRLEQALGSGDLNPAADWILRESAAGWGNYLSLLDPAAMSASSSPWDETPTEPEPAEAEPAIDLAALLRTLAGSGPAAPQAPPPKVEPGLAPVETDEAEPLAREIAVSGGAEDSDDRAEIDLAREARAVHLDADIRAVFAADLSDLFDGIQEQVL